MNQTAELETVSLTIKRTFASPVEKVYQAWTDPSKMVRWLSSNERWISPLIDINPVPGGVHNITMRHSDGDMFHMVGHYIALELNRSVTFTWKCLEDPTEYKENVVKIELRAVDGGTELMLIHDGLIPGENRDSTEEGWNGCLDMLDLYLQGKPQFTP